MYTYANPDNLAELSQREVRNLFPLVSFPSIIEPHHVAALGLLPVEADTMPTLADGETLQEGSLRLDGDQIRKGWVVVPAPLPDLPTLMRFNNDAYDRATAALIADYPQLEKDTWATQDKESAAWVDSPNTAITPFLDRAASERGIGREDYIRRTLIKARQFVIMSAFLTGRRQKYEDQIKAGGNPALDFALTPAIMAELQQVADIILSADPADMKAALA